MSKRIRTFLKPHIFYPDLFGQGLKLLCRAVSIQLKLACILTSSVMLCAPSVMVRVILVLRPVHAIQVRGREERLGTKRDSTGDVTFEIAEDDWNRNCVRVFKELG